MHHITSYFVIDEVLFVYIENVEHAAQLRSIAPLKVRRVSNKTRPICREYGPGTRIGLTNRMPHA